MDAPDCPELDRLFYSIWTEVHLDSSFPCEPIQGLTSLEIIPIGMSGIYAQPEVRSGGAGRALRRILPVNLRTRIRQMLAPSSFPNAASALRSVIERVHPDLVHAMRIPFEGMVASLAVTRVRKQTKKVDFIHC
jgi:hypothetical protein